MDLCIAELKLKEQAEEEEAAFTKHESLPSLSPPPPKGKTNKVASSFPQLPKISLSLSLSLVRIQIKCGYLSSGGISKESCK